MLVRIFYNNCFLSSDGVAKDGKCVCMCMCAYMCMLVCKYEGEEGVWAQDGKREREREISWLTRQWCMSYWASSTMEEIYQSHWKKRDAGEGRGGGRGEKQCIVNVQLLPQNLDYLCFMYLYVLYLWLLIKEPSILTHACFVDGHYQMV